MYSVTSAGVLPPGALLFADPSSLLTDAVIEDGQPLRTEAKPEA